MTIRDRWEALTEKQRGFLTWGIPLFASGLLVAADWVWRQSEGVASPTTARRLLTRVGIGFVLWVIVKVAFTRRWTFDGVGAVWAMLGVAGAFIRVFARHGPQPVSEAERDLIQSALDVGAAILIVSLIVWLIAKWFEHRRGSVPWDEVTERRKDQRRRWPDRRKDE